MAGCPKKRYERAIAREMAKTPGASRKTIVMRLAKRKERAKTSLAERSAKRAEECAACRDMDLIMRQVERRPTGCWLWQGALTPAISGRPRPTIRVGQYGRGFADLILWELTKGKRIRKGVFLKPGCGDYRCVRPEHQLETNTPVERAIRREKGGCDEYEEGLVERKVG